MGVHLQSETKVIIPAGQPNTGVQMFPLPDGTVRLEILHEGVRMNLTARPEDTIALGVGLIQCATTAQMLVAPQGLLKGKPVEDDRQEKPEERRVRQMNAKANGGA